MSMKRPNTGNRKATEDVRTMGGKELVMNRLVNHYKALSNVKAKVIIESPHPHVDADHEQEDFFNIRQTYKGVAGVKPMVDSNQPFTFNMGKKLTQVKGNDKFDDMEHVRRLNAMSKRILSLGKPHERRKNINDPIANPTYFFRKPGDEKAIKLVSLDKFNDKLKEMNNGERNKLLLGASIYNSLGAMGTLGALKNVSTKNSEIDNKRPKTATAYNTFIKYNTDNKNKNKNIKDKGQLYTHIFVDPEAILKEHMKERIKNEKNEIEIINFTKQDIQTKNSNFNKSSSIGLNVKYISPVSTQLDNNSSFPVVDKTKTNVKEDFQMKIIKFIIAKRIYKENDMDMLYKQLVLKNKNYASEDEIKEVFDHVKEELDK